MSEKFPFRIMVDPMFVSSPWKPLGPGATPVLAACNFSIATVQAQDYLYETNNGSITIIRYIGPGGNVSIPSTINGLPVTSIRDSAFASCTNLTNATIPKSITSIGEGAFFGCESMTSVTIGNSVTNIGRWAFEGCIVKLTSVSIPDSVTSIGHGAFLHCRCLTSIMVDALNSFYSSLDDVLFNKSRTMLIQFPEGKAGRYTVPGTVSSIGGFAFSGCTKLTEVLIPENVTRIEDGFADNYGALLLDAAGAFSGCIYLTNVNIPKSVTRIGDGAFHGCYSLSSVTMGDSVISIGAAAFSGCTNLSSITIPDSVTSISRWAFYYCFSLPPQGMLI